MERHGELEGGTGTGLRFHPNLPTAVFDDLLADGQADAVARIFAASVQTLEDHENTLGVLRSNSNSVVGHAEQPIVTRFLGRHRDHWWRLSPELDGVSDQILEDLRDLGAVGPHA